MSFFDVGVRVSHFSTAVLPLSRYPSFIRLKTAQLRGRPPPSPKRVGPTCIEVYLFFSVVSTFFWCLLIAFGVGQGRTEVPPGIFFLFSGPARDLRFLPSECTLNPVSPYPPSLGIPFSLLPLKCVSLIKFSDVCCSLVPMMTSTSSSCLLPEVDLQIQLRPQAPRHHCGNVSLFDDPRLFSYVFRDRPRFPLSKVLVQ